MDNIMEELLTYNFNSYNFNSNKVTIKVINNKLQNQENYKGDGALQQFIVHGASDIYMHGNPEISFFKPGQKYLHHPEVYSKDLLTPFKVRSDDTPVPTVYKLTYSPNPTSNIVYGERYIDNEENNIRKPEVVLHTDTNSFTYDILKPFKVRDDDLPIQKINKITYDSACYY